MKEVSFLYLQKIILRPLFVKQFRTLVFELIHIQCRGIQKYCWSVCISSTRESERERGRGRESLARLKQVLVNVQLNKQMFSLFFYSGSTGIQQLSQDICSRRPRLNIHPIGGLLSPLGRVGAVWRLAARARAQKGKPEPWEFSETFSSLSWLLPTSASNQC